MHVAPFAGADLLLFQYGGFMNKTNAVEESYGFVTEDYIETCPIYKMCVYTIQATMR